VLIAIAAFDSASFCGLFAYVTAKLLRVVTNDVGTDCTLAMLDGL